MAVKKVVKKTKAVVTKEPKQSGVSAKSKVTKQSGPAVIPAKAGNREKNGSRIKSGMTTSRVEATLQFRVVDIDGKAAGTVLLPKAIFGAKINPPLMAQEVRVYLANQRQGNASTKTRGEVSLTTAKWYRQKGTGRARHGAKSAPIFVKGGVAHGPKLRDFSLRFPTKMRHAALFSSLTEQLTQERIVVVSGLEKVGSKTKHMAKVLDALGKNKKTLIVMPKLLEEVYRAGRNIPGVTLSSASELSAYTVLGAGKIVFMKEAIEKLSDTFVQKHAVEKAKSQ